MLADRKCVYRVSSRGDELWSYIPVCGIQMRLYRPIDVVRTIDDGQGGGGWASRAVRVQPIFSFVLFAQMVKLYRHLKHIYVKA